MSFNVSTHIDIDAVMKAEPIKLSMGIKRLSSLFICLGALTFVVATFGGYPLELAWATYYQNLVFFMGLSCGGVIIAAIVQIVRAKWAPPVRRITEANVAFLPWAWMLFMLTWFGKSYLFPWGGGQPMPGREWWMQAGFVYVRFGLLLALLFFMMSRFVRLSLRSDIGVLRENAATRPHWGDWIYQYLARGWQGSEKEIVEIQRKLSWNAPLLIVVYAVIYSLFSFELVMGMDKSWVSNLFGAFQFIGNIYLAWAMLGLLVVYFVGKSPVFERCIGTQQLWDIGKLTFGFCMLWGYMFFSQFLPQWYGNLPEETQWMIIRSRIYPWWGLGWATFAACFIMPFILLLSEDLKRSPKALTKVLTLIFVGIWLEKYMIIMPQVSPTRIPTEFTELVFQFFVTLGFLGAYLLSVHSFIAKYPCVPFSHPLSKGCGHW